MPDSRLEAACRCCSQLNLRRTIENARLVVLVVTLLLMLAQDGVFKAATGFGVTSIEPCEDTARGGRTFFLLQWVPTAGLAANATTCVEGAELMRQNRDTTLASLPPSESVVARVVGTVGCSQTTAVPPVPTSCLTSAKESSRTGCLRPSGPYGRGAARERRDAGAG